MLKTGKGHYNAILVAGQNKCNFCLKIDKRVWRGETLRSADLGPCLLKNLHMVFSAFIRQGCKRSVGCHHDESYHKLTRVAICKSRKLSGSRGVSNHARCNAIQGLSRFRPICDQPSIDACTGMQLPCLEGNLRIFGRNGQMAVVLGSLTGRRAGCHLRLHWHCKAKLLVPHMRCWTFSQGGVLTLYDLYPHYLLQEGMLCASIKRRIMKDMHCSRSLRHISSSSHHFLLN